jgi:hypothetical protein
MWIIQILLPFFHFLLVYSSQETFLSLFASHDRINIRIRNSLSIFFSLLSSYSKKAQYLLLFSLSLSSTTFENSCQVAENEKKVSPNNDCKKMREKVAVKFILILEGFRVDRYRMDIEWIFFRLIDDLIGSDGRNFLWRSLILISWMELFLKIKLWHFFNFFSKIIKLLKFHKFYFKFSRNGKFDMFHHEIMKKKCEKFS